MSYPDAPESSAPIAHVSYQTRIGPAETPWWRRKPTTQTMAIGVAGALAFAILLGLLLTPHTGEKPVAAAEKREAVTPAAMVEQFKIGRSTEPYRAPDSGQVDRAYADVQKVMASGGVSGLARAGLECFRGLEQRPTYAMMDYCIAFDLFAEAQNAKLAGGEAPSATSWFGSAGARELNVAQSVMAVEGDADARLLDLRRIASTVSSRRGGPPLIEAIPGVTTPVGPPPATALRPVSDSPAANTADQLAIQVVEPAPLPAAAPARLPVASAPAPVRRAATRPAPQPEAVLQPAADNAGPAGDEFPDPPAVRGEPIEVPPPPAG